MELQIRPNAREERRHIRYRARTASPQPSIKANTAVNDAVFFLYPWKWFQYPGIHKGISSVIGLFDPSIIRKWRKGTAHPAPAVIDTLAAHLEAKAARAAELAAALRAYAAERRASDRRKIRRGVARAKDGDGREV